MDRDTLRSVQAPLKERYRAEPASALVTLRADGELGAGVSCSVRTHAELVEAGLHEATGGDGTQVCSGDLLLQALVACAGVTLRAVATSLDVPLAGGSVRAEGDLDFRGTLGVDRDAPVGFSAIRLFFDVAVPEESRAKLLELTERYCVVYQTLAGGVAVSAAYGPAPAN